MHAWRGGGGGEGGGAVAMHAPPACSNTVCMCICASIVHSCLPSTPTPTRKFWITHSRILISSVFTSHTYISHTHTKWRNTLQTRARPHSRTRTTSARGTHRTTSMRTHPSHSLLPSRIPSWTTFLQRA